MNREQVQKVTANHLARDAYLYVRQATLCQDLENDESIQRQYDLARQAVEMGWPIEKVIVIDSDIGQSGNSQKYRPGFRQLVRQIETECTGIVMALDTSRFTRNVTDSHRLCDACEISQTLFFFKTTFMNQPTLRIDFFGAPDPITELTKADAEL